MRCFLEVTVSLSDRIDIGLSFERMELPKAHEPYTGVVIHCGEIDNGDGTHTEVVYEAGNKTGEVLHVDCPWGTQTMANNIMQAIDGYVYQPMTLDGAIIDPAAELGDTIVADGIATVLASQDINFTSLSTSNVSAPTDAETNIEFPVLNRNERALARKINEVSGVSASLRVDINAISATVNDTQNGLAALEVKVDNQGSEISAVVEHGDIKASAIVRAINDYSEIALAADKITLEGDTVIRAINNGTGRVTIEADKIDISGVVTFSDLSRDGGTVINAGNIKTGTIYANTISVFDKFEVLDGTGWPHGYVGGASGSDGTEETYGPVLMSSRGQNYVFVSDKGVRLQAGGTEFYITTPNASSQGQAVMTAGGNRVTLNADGLFFNNTPIA